MKAVVWLFLLVSPAAAQLSFEPPRPGREKLPRQIQAWRPGTPIPAEALRFEPSLGCLALPTDSDVIIREAKNYPFLIALATHREADPDVVRLAVRRAMLLRGPTAAFGDLQSRYRSSPALPDLRVHQDILARMRQRHVWVTGIDVEPAAFGKERSKSVLDDIAVRLRAGEAWQSVYDEYSCRYPQQGGGTYIGNFGSYVASEVRDEKKGGLDLLVPAYHMDPLLRAQAGDLLILTAQPGGYGFPIGHGPFLILWQVHEVYSPSAVADAK